MALLTNEMFNTFVLFFLELQERQTHSVGADRENLTTDPSPISDK